MYAVAFQFIVGGRAVGLGIFFHRRLIAYAVARWLSCRIYGGGDYMPLGKAATVAAVVGANHAVRHQLELDCFFSIHNILANRFVEQPPTTHGHKLTVW